jgi:hypothetical protein
MMTMLTVIFGEVFLVKMLFGIRGFWIKTMPENVFEMIIWGFRDWPHNIEGANI